jgi:hypothetical protein
MVIARESFPSRLELSALPTLLADGPGDITMGDIAIVML